MTRQKPAEYPNTFLVLPNSVAASRKEIFDPALKHFPNAFRQGDPTFASGAQAQSWREMRRRALEHVLRVVAQSRWGESLVLRGSVLLGAWLGTAAREPGDIDFVVEPPSFVASHDILNAIVDLVAETPTDGAVRMSTREAAIDAIWTYERAEGRRLVLPWSAVGVPLGGVQIDFVFQEPLAVAPCRVQVPSIFGAPISVRAATPELSLAWKILWLATDGHPQGKDLYDATLLAETFSLSRELLGRVLRSTPEGGSIVVDATMPLNWHVEWQHLIKEYPSIQGDAENWKKRLSSALARGFTATAAPYR